MRTAADFNLYYASPDPWHISHARFRDRVLRRRLKRFIRGKSVLELGCGEGHLTHAVFGEARSVVGVDISDVAIGRAKSLNLPNARFETADFLNTSFEGYDVIAALECVYYLSLEEQAALLQKIAKEHSGKILLLSGPIVDYRRHFSHKRLMHGFTTFGFAALKFYNLSVYWHPPSSRIVGQLIKLPLGYTMLDWMPESMIYQRLYALRAPLSTSLGYSVAQQDKFRVASAGTNDAADRTPVKAQKRKWSDAFF
jgi:SAM-dependent methyltransferase